MFEMRTFVYQKYLLFRQLLINICSEVLESHPLVSTESSRVQEQEAWITPPTILVLVTTGGRLQ